MGKNPKIILILVLATALRLINLNQSFWLDEGAQMMMSQKSLSFQWFGRANDFHPPLFYFLIHFWLQVGKSEWFLRLPSVFFGVATVYLVYLLSKRFFSEKIGFVSALLVAVAPYHIYYSQETRMYSLFAFLATASMLFLMKESWISYILTTTAMLYAHYASFFLIFAQIIWVFFWQRKVLGRFVKSLLVCFVFFLPWLPQFFKQLGSGSNLVAILPGWRDIANLPLTKALPLTFIKFSLGRISIFNKNLYAVVAIFMAVFYGFLFFQALKKFSKEKIFLLNWLLIPIFATLVISIFIPMYQPFRLLFTLIPFYILLTIGILSLKKKWQLPALILVLLISLSGLGAYYLNPRFQREDWQGTVQYVEAQDPGESVAIFEFSQPFAPYQWYAQGIVKACGVLPGLRASPELVEEQMLEATEGAENIFLFQYLQPLTDPENLVSSWLKENGFQEKGIKDFSGVGFVYNYIRE